MTSLALLSPCFSPFQQRKNWKHFLLGCTFTSGVKSNKTWGGVSGDGLGERGQTPKNSCSGSLFAWSSSRLWAKVGKGFLDLGKTTRRARRALCLLFVGKIKEPQTVWSRSLRAAFDTGMAGELARGLGFIQIRALFPQSFPRSCVSTGVSCGIHAAGDYSLCFPLHVTWMRSWKLVKQCCSCRRAVGWQQSCSCPGTVPGAVCQVGLLQRGTAQLLMLPKPWQQEGAPVLSRACLCLTSARKRKTSGVRLFGLQEVLDVLEELLGNAPQWILWCGYGIVHFGGAKVSFPEVFASLQTSTGAAADGKLVQKEVTSRIFLLPCSWTVN